MFPERFLNSMSAKVIVGILLCAALLLLVVMHQQQIRSSVADRDSIAYWAAGNLLLSGRNPCDADEVLRLQRAHGYQGQKALVLRTPPWSLWMILPLGLFDSFGAWLLWLAALLAAFLISMRISWRMYGDGARPPTAFLLAGYLFAPIAACLVAGQLGIMLLLGVMLFLLFEESHPFLAGTALLLLFAKPHLVSLFWPIVIVWVVRRKKWWLAAGFLAAFALTTGTAWLLNPGIVAEYGEMVRTAGIEYEFIPALSGVVRLIFFRAHFWVQFLPMGVGFAWSAWYYTKHRHAWKWREQGPALLVVSALVAPYAWMTDEAILLPAILQSVMWIYSKRESLRLRSRLAVTIFCGFNALLLLLLRAKIPFATGIYFWSSLLWAGWYWYAHRFACADNQLLFKRALVEQGVPLRAP